MSVSTPLSSTEPSSRGTPRNRRGTAPGLKAQVVACLVRGLNVRQASREVGIRHDTVYGWLREDEEFQDMLAAAEDRLVETLVAEAVSDATANIKGLGPRAYERLREALEHESPRVYLPAVGYVLKYLSTSETRSLGLEQALAQLDATPTTGD